MRHFFGLPLSVLVLAAVAGEGRAASQIQDLLQVQPAGAWAVPGRHHPEHARLPSITPVSTPAGPGIRVVSAAGKGDCGRSGVERRFTLPAPRAAAGATLSCYYNAGAAGKHARTSFTVILALAGKPVGRRTYRANKEIPAGRASVLDLGAFQKAWLFDEVRVRLHQENGFNELSDLTLASLPQSALSPSQGFQALIGLVGPMPKKSGERVPMLQNLQAGLQSALNGEAAGSPAAALQAFDAAQASLVQVQALVADGQKKLVKAMVQAWLNALQEALAETGSSLAQARAQATQGEDAPEQTLQSDLDQALARLKQAFPDSPDEVAWRQAAMQETLAAAEGYLQDFGTDAARRALIRKGARSQFYFYVTTWFPQFQFGYHPETEFLNDPGTLGGGLQFEVPFYISWTGPPLPALDIVAEGTQPPDSVRIGDNLDLAFGSLEGSVFVDASNCGPDDLLLLTLTVTAPDGRTCARAGLIRLDNP